MKRMNIFEEAGRCLLCKEAPCTRACGHGDPARAIRAIRFGNAKLVNRWIADCTDADLERAEQACIHYDRPVRIKELLRAIRTDEVAGTYPDLGIDFCGLHCENPFFLASSAICTNYEMVARAFEAGWAGVYYKTICLQDIQEVSPRFDAIHKYGIRGDFYGFRNMEQLSENPVEMDLDILRRLKQDYPNKIVIASIMGQTEEQWIELAKKVEAVGVDAVELNFSCPQMRLAGMGSDVGQNSELVLFYTAYVKRSVRIPVIPKMTPNITHINEPALSAFLADADAISAINTIKSVSMSDKASVSGRKTISGLSGRAIKPIALRCILDMAQNTAIRGGHGRSVELSGIGGIETWRDALEFIQLGCSNVQVCTAVMQYGYRIIDDLVVGFQHYMAQRGVSHVSDLVGEQLPSFVQPSDLDRQTLIYPKIDREKCIGCGRCEISCSDGGHQAIRFDPTTRQPHIIGEKCVGCHLCRLVCPSGAIGLAQRIPKKQSNNTLNTDRVFSIFHELNQTPRPSHHEERVADYLCQFAERLHLEYERDKENCVVIRKPASPGHEGAEPIVLLNHMDMVCVGMNDPLNDPIEAYEENGWMKARGTSLGADNGIGLSMALAVLEDDRIVHPALEVITTTNEEDGMSGASQLGKDFLKGRKVINLDSEDYDTITTGAAGACLQFHRIPVQPLPAPKEGSWYRIRMSGGLGGHSGVDINKGRCSAMIPARSILKAMCSNDGIEVADIQIGEANASIASSGEMVVYAKDADACEFLKGLLDRVNQMLHEQFADSDPRIECNIENCDKQDTIFPKETLAALVDCLEKVPQGVVKMSESMPGTVETSNNVGRLVAEGDHLFVSTHTRSFVDDDMAALSKTIASAFATAGAVSEVVMSAPAWQEDQQSPFLQMVSDTFQNVLGWRPRMVAMHFVLEAGFFVQHYPGIQIASIGPRIVEPHSTSERVELSTIHDIWKVLIELLKRLA